MKALAALSLAALVTFFAVDAQAVLNGTTRPSITPLTNGQVLAIGFLADANGAPFCSGTVIRRDAVLTAQHCVKDLKPGDVLFGIGTGANPTALIRVKRISLADWESDLALLQLDGDATSVGGLEVIPFNRAALGEALIDSDGEIAGYAPIDGIWIRHFGVLAITNVFDAVKLDGQGHGSACKGDSGGPFLWVDDAGHATVAGTAMSGNLSCMDEVYYSRTDRHAAWIDQELAWFAQNTNDGTPSEGSRLTTPDPWSCAAGGAETATPIGLAVAGLLLGAMRRRS